MCYNPQESLENTINTMGTLLGVHPSVPSHCVLTILKNIYSDSSACFCDSSTVSSYTSSPFRKSQWSMESTPASGSNPEERRISCQCLPKKDLIKQQTNIFELTLNDI